MREVIQYPDGKSFLKDTLAFLEQEEARNAVLIGIAMANIQVSEGHSVKPLFFTIKKKGEVVCCGVQTPPRNMIVYGTDAYAEEAAVVLCDHLSKHNYSLPGVGGPVLLARCVAQHWANYGSLRSEVMMRSVIYQLDQVNNLDPPAGTFRKASSADIPLVAGWITEFVKESLPGESLSVADIFSMAAERIGQGEIFLWEDNGQPVSMAGSARETKNGASVNYVYTPPVYRGKGYATGCVSGLSKVLLGRGKKFCALYADTNNPLSNKIYLKIGYRPIAEFEQIHFFPLANTR